MSIDALYDRIKYMNCAVCAGLDPRASYAQERRPGQNDAEVIFGINKRIMDSLSGVVPAVKPQCAYYELLGPEGAQVLAQTIKYARAKGFYVIADAKRGDIGATAEAYAESFLGENAPYPADAVTVNAYLGTDGVAPFLKRCGNKAIFVLVKTSNPSSGELQDIKLASGETVYEKMGAMVSLWGKNCPGKCGYSNCGAVVGATYPSELETLRKKLPETFFLVPGYGAQGAGASDVAGAFDENGGGAVVNSSRGIMCAWKKRGGELGDAALAEAKDMRDALNRAVYAKFHSER